MIIEDDFSEIDPGTAFDATADYADVVGSSMTFITGSRQLIELSVSTGENFGRIVDRPEILHQSVGCLVQFGSSLGSTAFTGVFARYIDVDNYVLARINHNTRQAELIERVAGVSTTIISLAITAGGSELGAAIKMELVGRRARLFFEPHFRPMPDRPPDAAANLTGVYSDPGDWGVYMDSNDGGNTMRAESLLAEPIPSAVMPAPSLLVEPADAFRFAPLTVALTGVTADDIELLWEIYPADADDFAEVYRDKTPPSTVSRVFWVRQGHGYFVRVREVAIDGTLGDWLQAGPIVATGDKASPPETVLPDDIFPDVIPSYVLRWEPTDESASAVISTTGKARLISAYFRPRANWTMRFENRTKAELLPLRSFFRRMRGMATPFQWSHPITGDPFAARFQKDELDFTPIDQAVELTDVIATFEMPITEIVTTGISILTFTLQLDPGLY